MVSFSLRIGLTLQSGFTSPPAETINKDFLKAVMGGEKDILPMDVVKMADVPRYEELSVKAILPKV